jgi:4-amino-4-deoxy-L-arabinose transferase-like glycosyltransferase
MLALNAAPARDHRGRLGLHLACVSGLVLLPLLIGLPGIETLGFHHGDETNYMQIAAHMLESGNYLVPVFHGRLILDRAPLLYWLIAASFRLFGMSLWAARLPSLLAAGFTLALIYWFVVRVYGSARGGIYAALAMAASPVTWWIMRLAVPDMLMTAGVFIAVACYCEATRGSRRRLFLLLASTGIGLAGMAKGHVGIVVASVPLVLLLFIDRGKPHALRLRDLLAPWTWAPATLLAGWWYAYLVFVNAPVLEYAQHHVDPNQTLGQALIRFLLAEAEHQIDGGWTGLRRNLGDYGPGLFFWFAPWSFFALGGLFLGQRRLRQDWYEHERPTTALLATIVSVTSLYTFFVLELRSMRYLLPIGPAMAILGTRWWTKREAAHHRATRTPVVIATAMILVSIILFTVTLPSTVQPPLEHLCAILRPQLTGRDTVVVAGLREKWATFAMVMLNHQVDSVAADAAALAQWAQRHDLRVGQAYVLTTPEMLEQVRQHLPDSFALVSQGAEGWLSARRGLWEPVLLLRLRHDSGEVEGR